MRGKKSSVIKKVLVCLFVCILLLSAAFIAINISDPIRYRVNAFMYGIGFRIKCTPLTFATMTTGNPKIITALIKLGADINKEDRNELTPLRIATLRNQTELVTFLINAGADVNMKATTTGVTPLMYTVIGSPDLKIVNIFIESGANVNAEDESGMTPLMYAAASSRMKPEILTALINAGADVNAKANNGTTPLIYATKLLGNPKTVITLISAGADVNAKTDDGTTPLIAAAGRYDTLGDLTAAISALLNEDPKAAVNFSLEMVTALVKAGADVNAKANDGTTPLIAAAMHTRTPEVIITLLDLGADQKATDDSGKTALDYANENENLQNTDALRRLGG